MPESTYHPQDYLNAEEICGFLSGNFKIQFQLEAEQWDREEAKKHFNKRQALQIVRTLLLDEGERTVRSS